jgi:hypothetical protein
MIVSCPSCHQRYRHDFDVHPVSERAHCSSCDEHFELAVPKRQYMVVEAGSLPQPLWVPVVRDDAPQPQAAAASSIEIDLPAAETPAVFDVDLSAAEAAPVSDVAAMANVGSLDDAVSETGSEATPQAESVPAVQPAASVAGALLEGLVALVPCGIGAGLAYHFAGPMGQDPITWAALGGAIGLLLGWACLLWITHGD